MVMAARGMAPSNVGRIRGREGMVGDAGGRRWRVVSQSAQAEVNRLNQLIY